MSKIIARINKKTGQLTLSVDGVTGPACLLLTQELRERLGMTEEPTPTEDMWRAGEQSQQQQST